MKQLITVNNICVAGIYTISDKDGTVLYIGSSSECNYRRSYHLSMLKYGKYGTGNKKPLQDAFDNGDLYFKVIHVSAYNKQVNQMTEDEKVLLQKSLGVLEEFYINLYKDTVCNKNFHVTKYSTKGNSLTYLKRHFSNLGENNPNCRINQMMAANILWLKLNGYKIKEILSLLKSQSIYLSQTQVSNIGIKRWKHIEPIKPLWITDVKNIEYGA